MAGRYQFSEEEIKAIEQKRKENKDKRAEARLNAQELRAKGAKVHEVAAATGFHAAYVTQLVAKYRNNGLKAIAGSHYGGNHRKRYIMGKRLPPGWTGIGIKLSCSFCRPMPRRAIRTNISTTR